MSCPLRLFPKCIALTRRRALFATTYPAMLNEVFVLILVLAHVEHKASAGFEIEHHFSFSASLLSHVAGVLHVTTARVFVFGVCFLSFTLRLSSMAIFFTSVIPIKARKFYQCLLPYKKNENPSKSLGILIYDLPRVQEKLSTYDWRQETVVTMVLLLWSNKTGFR